MLDMLDSPLIPAPSTAEVCHSHDGSAPRRSHAASKHSGLAAGSRTQTGRLTAVRHAAVMTETRPALGRGQPFRSARMRRLGRSKRDPCGVSGIGMHNITKAGPHRGATAWAGSGRTVTRWRRWPHRPWVSSNTPAHDVPQRWHRPSAVRCQAVSSYQSRPINSASQP
jgi:hypothetical protein